MSAGQGALRSVEQAQKLEAERLLVELVARRKELAQRDAVLSELQRTCEDLARKRMHARDVSAGASEVLAMRWAHDHVQALEREQAAVEKRMLALQGPRAQLAQQVRELERSWIDAEVARRAVGTVIERRERAEQRLRELAEEDALTDLANSRPPAK